MTGIIPYDFRPALPVLLSTLIAGCVFAQREPLRPNDDDVAANDDDVLTNDDDAGVDDDDTTGSLSGAFLSEVSAAVCNGLVDCCGSDALALYFGPMRDHALLAPLVGQMPPNAELTAETCPGLLASAWDITPFGDWLRAVDAGSVAFDEDLYGNCLADLHTASCGEQMRTALWDGSCFGFSAPFPPKQRSVFERSGSEGDACTPISDGIGAGFFGTCDPTRAFCCFDDDGSCGLPYDGEGNARSGTCAPVADAGEACSLFDPVSLCATGLECIEGGCVEPATTPLSVGDPCIDDLFTLLGDCVDSYCDMFETGTCQPLVGSGADCTAGWECESGVCESGQCVENTMCAGF